jgi:hypothetical protein
MRAATDNNKEWLRFTGFARPKPVSPIPPIRGALVSISAETYGRLMSLADEAPIDCLPLTSRTLAHAKTLGYNQIGQVRHASVNRLLQDLGADRTDEFKRALYDFGMRQPGAAESHD